MQQTMKHDEQNRVLRIDVSRNLAPRRPNLIVVTLRIVIESRRSAGPREDVQGPVVGVFIHRHKVEMRNTGERA